MNGVQHMLEVKDLKKHFLLNRSFLSSERSFIKALDGVSFNLKRGQTLGLVGESGSGKSTCARLILRLMEPTEGSIIFEGQDIMAAKGEDLLGLRRAIQMVFQDPYSSLNPRKSVLDIVGDPLLVHGLAKGREVREKTDELLHRVGLSSSHLGSYPHELSGGQRQRVAVARALSLGPKLLVCDEPVSALDVSVQAQVINLLKDTGADLNLAMLFISHDLQVVRHVSDRVAVMYFGQIVEAAPKKVIFTNPRHPYTEVLLEASSNSLNQFALKGEPPSPLNPPPGCPFSPRCPRAKAECSKHPPEKRLLEEDHFLRCIL